MKIKLNNANISYATILLVTTQVITVSTAFSCGGSYFDGDYKKSQAFLQTMIDDTERAKTSSTEQEISEENKNSKSSVQKVDEFVDKSSSSKIALLHYQGEDKKAHSLLIQTKNAIKKRYESYFMGSLTASGKIQELESEITTKLDQLKGSE